MPRRPRIHAPGAFYHVTLRGNHRQDIFFAPGDRHLFTDIVAEVLSRFNARMHAYCLMTNHIHLLMQVGEVPLGRLMLRIASRYARTIQKRFATTGHLFERRYHALLVDADAYLLELLRYIHLNPVRARMVAKACDYPWSSHLAYLGQRSEPWLTTEFALAMFHSDPIHALSLYQRFISETADQLSPSLLAQANTNDARVLGNDRFLQSLSLAWQPRSRVTLTELIDTAHRQFNVSTDALLSPSRQRHLTHVRRGSLIKPSLCASPHSPKSPVHSTAPKPPSAKASNCTSTIPNQNPRTLEPATRHRFVASPPPQPTSSDRKSAQRLNQQMPFSSKEMRIKVPPSRFLRDR